MQEIVAIQQIQSLVVRGFTDWEQYGNVRAVYKDDLVLLSYTNAAQYENRWNWFERAARGLILNVETGEVIARGFDKFFNWLQGGKISKGHIVTITEKIDGSYGCLIRHQGQYKVATRGSFDGEQATWATQFLQENYDLQGLPNAYTLLFEIVYPENRIVVDYGTTKALYLLAIRDRFTGKYLPFYPDVYTWADKYGFPIPRTYDFNSVTDIIAATDNLPATEEGWVVEFSDGQRFKFKGDRYLELHRLITNTTFKRVLEAIAGGTYETLIWNVPDEFLTQIKEWKLLIDAEVKLCTDEVEAAFKLAPKDNRKQFAIWVNTHHKTLATYLFMRLDGRDYVQLIYQKEFQTLERMDKKWNTSSTDSTDSTENQDA